MTIVLVGTVACVIYHYIAAAYLHLHNPRPTFLFLPEDYFNDWDNLFIFARDFLDGIPGPYAYFPFAILSSVGTTLLPMRLGMVLLVALFLFVLAVMLARWAADAEEDVLTRVQQVFIVIVLSYPVLFALDRGNLEMLLFVLIAGFFYFLYVRESPWLAALLLAAAIAFKLYPATLLLLLLAERRYKPLGLTVVLAVARTAVSALAVSALGGFSLAELSAMNTSGKQLYQVSMVDLGGGVQHGHTLWGVFRLAMKLRERSPESMQTTLYAVASALAFLALAVHTVFRETERWKRVLFSVAPALLLPYVSADYTLIQMYFPLVFFLRSPRKSRRDFAYVVLFALLFIPLDYYYLTADPAGISVSVVVYAVALLGLVVLAFDREVVLSGLPDRADETADLRSRRV